MSALFAQTWYDTTAIPPPKTTPLGGVSNTPYDVAIIGGGLAGLTALYQLARNGVNAVLLEARTIASGASGRNGGFCSPGWAADHEKITRLVGQDAANHLADIAEHGTDWMRDMMAQPSYANASPKFGELILSRNAQRFEASGTQQVMERSDLRQVLNTDSYKHGLFDPNAFHFHPLNFMRQLAQDAISAGGQIVEHAPVTQSRRMGDVHHLTAGTTSILARTVIHAIGGYGGRENAFARRHLLPIRTYIGVSAPMRDVLDHHIRCDWAIADTRRAGNYYRRLPDGRLLWGMAITAFGTLDVKAVKNMVRRDIAKTFPKLAVDMRDAGIGIDFAWAGNMAYARHFMPFVGQITPHNFMLAGFGGHGMNTAPAAAIALTDYILGKADTLDAFNRVPRPRVWGVAGAIAAETTYRWMQCRDALSEIVD